MARAPLSHRRSLARLVLAGLCAVAAGCGGDEDSASPAGSDEQQIRRAVERLMESETIRDQCELGVSERFVRESYGTLARCRAANRPDGDDDPPDRATIAATRIDDDGAKATTAVTLTSAKGARVTGRLALVKAGAAWKVDRLGVDFLRSLLQALPKQADSAQDRLVLGCLAESARALPDADVRRLGNLIVGQRLAPDAFPADAVECLHRSVQPRQTI